MAEAGVDIKMEGEVPKEGAMNHEAHMQTMMSGIDGAIQALEAGDAESALGMLKGLKGEEQKEMESEGGDRRGDLQAAMKESGVY